MHITNPDGSVPEMCGNGLRCVALHLLGRGALAEQVSAVVDTDAGALAVVVTAKNADASAADVRIDMGPARFDVPVQFPASFRRELLASLIPGEAALHSARTSSVSMGNPHLVIEHAPSAELAARIGPALENARVFPERTNVELAALRGDGTIDVVVWERGAGLTQACGTGACGVAAVFARAGLVPYDVDVTVRLPGGPLAIRVPRDNNASVLMTGPARRAFTGSF
jgi:diaminopimelate epimerase